MAVFQLNCSLGLWSFSLNTSWWIEVTLEIRKKKLDCSLFGFKDYWWLSSTPLFQPSSASSPLFYNSFLLQKRHLPLPHRKFVLIFYFVPSPISASFFSSWPFPSFRPQLKPLWRHCGVVNCGIEKVRPLTEKHFFLIMENSIHKSRVDYILVITNGHSTLVFVNILHVLMNLSVPSTVVSFSCLYNEE